MMVIVGVRVVSLDSLHSRYQGSGRLWAHHEEVHNVETAAPEGEAERCGEGDELEQKMLRMDTLVHSSTCEPQAKRNRWAGEQVG